MIGQRQADRDPAVVLLAELAAVLTRHPDRVTAFLGKSGVVDDPGFDRAAAFDDRQGQFANPVENPLVRPRRVGDEISNDWCLAETRAGAVIAAIGSTLLRSPGINKPRQ